MAIPFNLPTDEETEEIYRRLDQLLLDLYDILRQILLRRRIQRTTVPVRPAAQDVVSSAQPPFIQPPQEQPPQPELPDLVQSLPTPLARKPPVPPPRRRRRRTQGESNKTHQQHQQQHQVQQGDALQQQQAQQGSSWLNVGIELRQIAEEFRSSQFYGGVEKRRKEIKASSLFSLLVPAPLTGSIWTTVIILVGWRILARHR